MSKDRPDSTRLRYAPESQRALGRGIAALEQVLGTTIGPSGRQVAITPVGRPGTLPELLDDGGTIARRMIGLPDPFENMGFMLARQAAWTMRAQSGDGAATAVAIMGATFRRLETLTAAGFNRVELRRGVELGMSIAIDAIDAAARPFAQADFEPFLRARLSDQKIARRIGQAVEAIGPDAFIDVRAATDGPDRLDLVEGALWETTGQLSPLHQHVHDAMRIHLSPARILLWDGDITDAGELARMLERLQSLEIGACAVVARTFSPLVAGTIRQNFRPDFQIVPVLAPQAGSQQEEAFRDLAALTGAKVRSPVAGNMLSGISDDDLGASPRIVIGARFFNVQSNDRQVSAVTERVGQVQRQIEGSDAEQEIDRLRLRLARLQQRLAVIWIGSGMHPARDAKLAETRQAISELRAVQSGTVPGGGTTLARIAFDLAASGHREECPGLLAAADGLLAPARWIAMNAGLEPATVLGNLRGLEIDHGYDIRSRSIVNLCEVGIVDAADTLKSAVTIGLSMAMQANDCEVLVRRDAGLGQAEIAP